jgi:PAS domain S-box-containing protein
MRLAVPNLNRSILGYSIAVLSVALALLVSTQIPFMFKNMPVAAFCGAVAVSTWIGGRGPGLLAVLLSTFAVDYFIIPPLYTLDLNPTGIAAVLAFLVFAVLINVAVAALLDRTESLAAALSEQKRLRELLSNIANSSPSHIFAMDLQFRYTFANDAVAQMLGATADKVIGKSVYDFYPKELADELAATNRKIIETGVSDYSEIRIKDIDVYSVKVPLRDDSGAITGICGVATDITEQKRSRQKIDTLQELLRNIINKNPFMVFATDLEHRPIIINEEFANFMGLPESEIIGRSTLDLFPPELAERFIADNEAVIASGRTITVDEIGFDRKYMTTKFPIRNSAGETVGVGAIVVDMTERAELEEELRREHTLEAVGTLAGGIAHDFNNLMTVVTGFSELALQNTKTGDLLKPQIEHIRDAGNRAAELTRQLLAFGQKQYLQPEKIDLNAKIENLSLLLRKSLPLRIVIDTDLDPGLLPFEADPEQIGIVILNLAVNARDEMPDGGTLTIKTRNIDASDIHRSAEHRTFEGRFIKLTISDTGRGMDNEALDKIFDPYFSSERIGHGGGITLASVYGIVKQSGGEITVRSEVGRGTTFEIVFPCIEEIPAITV